MIVYILNKHGKPLMPTIRCGHVRWLLKHKKACVVGNNPFTIKLKYETENKTQPLTMGIDTGRTNIGISVVKDNGVEVFSAEVESRNKDVTKLMTARKEHRMEKRRHSRTKRQRRAVKNNVAFITKERYLPHYEKPIIVKYIKNKEARFCNRKRNKGWLTPTVRHCVQTHVNLVKKIAKFLPITNISIEVNIFDFQLMENSNIRSYEYSKGKLFGYKDVNHYVYECQDGKCLLCGGKIEHYHHIVPHSEGGSNTVENIVGLCKNCHTLVHKHVDIQKKLLELKEGIMKKYAGSSVINTAMPYIVDALSCYNLWLTTGKRTATLRKKYNVSKTHAHDAYCIAVDALNTNFMVNLMDKNYKIKQYRRHDRGIVHKANFDRKYYLDGVLVATNRHKSMCQVKDSLTEYKEKLLQQMGETQVENIISKLVCKVHKAVYKDVNRVMPGAIIGCENDIFVLKHTDGKRNNIPQYYVSEENKKYRYKACNVLQLNEGLVFMQ